MNLRVSTVLFGSASAGFALFTLLDTAAKGFAVFAVASLIALALRQASASARHIVWVSALTCALALPCCAWLLPQWRALPTWMSWEEVPKRLASATPVPTMVVPTRTASAPISIAIDVPVNISFPEPGSSAVLAEAVPLNSPIRLGAHTILLAWLGGTVLLLAPLFYSLLALRRISTRARLVSEGPLLAVMHDLQRELGLNRKVQLLLGDTDAMPMVWGILRSRLLLPSTAVAWAPSRLRGVLLHELAHLHRRDPLSMSIAQLALAVHWFNPLAWLAVRQLRAEQECACDDYVLRHGVRASDYASDLLAVATSFRGTSFASAALTMAHPARVEGRIMGILDTARNRRAVTRWVAVGAAVVAAAVALPLAMLRAAEEKSEPPTPRFIGPIERQAEPVRGTSVTISRDADPDGKPPQEVNGKVETEKALNSAVPSTPAEGATPAKPAPAQAKMKDTRGRILDLNGFVLAESADATSRKYPFQALAPHTLGYTGKNQETKRQEGKTGAEEIFDEPLRKGEDVQLSLDARLQSVTEKALREPDIGRGAVVILDPATGEVRALASTPNFDPNAFVPSISIEDWKELTDDKTNPLLNRALQAYAPGATYHLVVALAACRTGKADLTYTCSGVVTYGNKVMNCWISRVDPQGGGHGKLSLREALQKSCSCYFYQLGNAVGIQELEKTARDLGLGERSRLGLAGESPGLVPSPEWLKKTNPNERWSSGYTANVAVGQGSMLTTPLQMATVAAAIANGGRVPAPRLTTGGAPEMLHDLTLSGCKAEDFEMLRASMVDVVQSGTASKAKSNLISIAGRTGTSQYWREEDGKRVPELAAWFIGYAPAEAPRYAFAVLVEGGRSGGAAAAPLARRIMEAVAAGLPDPEPQEEIGGYFEMIPPQE